MKRSTFLKSLIAIPAVAIAGKAVAKQEEDVAIKYKDYEGKQPLDNRKYPLTESEVYTEVSMENPNNSGWIIPVDIIKNKNRPSLEEILRAWKETGMLLNPRITFMPKIYKK